MYPQESMKPVLRQPVRFAADFRNRRQPQEFQLPRPGCVDNVDLNECVITRLTIGKNVIKHKAEVVREFGVLPK
jgi:hypothetical protein